MLCLIILLSTRACQCVNGLHVTWSHLHVTWSHLHVTWSHLHVTWSHLHVTWSHLHVTWSHLHVTWSHLHVTWSHLHVTWSHHGLTCISHVLCRYSMLQKQVYELEAMRKLSPTCTSARLKEREMFEQNMDDSLSKCMWLASTRLQGSCKTSDPCWIKPLAVLREQTL